MFSTCPHVCVSLLQTETHKHADNFGNRQTGCLSVTKVVNTIFWERMNWFWYQMAQGPQGNGMKRSTLRARSKIKAIRGWRQIWRLGRGIILDPLGRIAFLVVSSRYLKIASVLVSLVRDTSNLAHIVFFVAALPGHSANATYAYKRPPDETTQVTDMQSLLDSLANQSCVAGGKPPSTVKPVSRMNLLSSLASIVLWHYYSSSDSTCY